MLRRSAPILDAGAADRSSARRSVKIAKSVRGQAPLRIMDIPKLRSEHNEIPVRMVADNPEVRSLSRCNACHTRAAEGYYNEAGINIPGYGNWDD
ncbi:MAG: hypothetical protein ACE5FN_06880 [Leptospirillia bacterium]